jgi:hypothetical protein
VFDLGFATIFKTKMAPRVLTISEEAKTLEVSDKAARQIQYAINKSKKTEMTLAVNAITSVG